MKCNNCKIEMIRIYVDCYQCIECGKKHAFAIATIIMKSTHTGATASLKKNMTAQSGFKSESNFRNKDIQKRMNKDFYKDLYRNLFNVNITK